MMEEEAQRDQSTPSRKIKPLQLREQYGLNIAQLAHQAKVAPRAVYFMLLGYPIERQEAEQILATISTIARQSYTLEHVQVALLSEEQEQAKRADGESGTEEEADSG